MCLGISPSFCWQKCLFNTHKGGVGDKIINFSTSLFLAKFFSLTLIYICLCGRLSNGSPKITAISCEYVTIHGKMDQADVIKNLEMGRSSWIIWLGQCNHKGPFKREVGKSEKEIGRGYPAGLEDGGRDHEPRNADILKNLEKARKQNFPLELPKGINPANTLTLAQLDRFWTSYL